MYELHELVRKYYPEVKIPSDSFDIVLETAAQELSHYFSILADEEQKNDLLVPDAEAVFDYVASYSAEAKKVIQKDKEQFLNRVRKEMDKDGLYHIHKSTGLFVCAKK